MAQEEQPLRLTSASFEQQQDYSFMKPTLPAFDPAERAGEQCHELSRAAAFAPTRTATIAGSAITLE